jgi:hypothetical protein
MSLWDKWEREKQERMGIKVERKSDVEIHDTREKPDARKQSMILVLAVLACFLGVYFCFMLYARYGDYWSDFPMIRALTSQFEYRIEQRRNQQ